MIEFSTSGKQKSSSLKTPHYVKKAYTFDDEEEDPLLKIKVTRKPYSMINQPKININKDYLKKISSDITFNDDVLRDRCFHLLPYDPKYLSETLSVGDLIPHAPKARRAQGRHNARGEDIRHMPCHFSKRSAHHLKPLHRKRSKKNAISDGAGENNNLPKIDIVEECPKLDSVHENIKKKEDILQRPLSQCSSTRKSGVFVTEDNWENNGNDVTKERKGQEEEEQWDKYLLTKLSDVTARWIAEKKVANGIQKDALLSFINEHHGVSTQDKVELVYDNLSDGVGSDDEKEDTNKQRLHKKPPAQKWQKPNDTFLDTVRSKYGSLKKTTEPYADDSVAAFYRLPAGIKKNMKIKDKENEAAINSTAHAVEVKRYIPPPPPTLKERLNPGIGKFILDTENLFQQETLAGAQQLHLSAREAEQKISLDSNMQYNKQLMSLTPGVPEVWYPLTGAEREVQKKEPSQTVHKQQKGMRRWTKLPEPVEENFDLATDQFEMQDSELFQAPDHSSRKQARNNSTLVQIINDWRARWQLDMRYADATPDDLILDMADMHPHIRLKAITTCARAAEYVPPTADGIKLDKADTSAGSQVKLLPEKLFVALECLLEDDHEQVYQAAAITLYTLQRPIKRAEAILRETLKQGRSCDRWTAAQCLAYYGDCDSEVVGELIAQLLYGTGSGIGETDDAAIRREQAAFLLARLSDTSTLVHSMLAEQLNSSSWKHRMLACKAIPKLHGQINKDMVNKLLNLMLNDVHHSVRLVAGHTLGKTGHGKAVHDQLRDLMLDGNAKQRHEAVSQVGNLGIMTAKLLPALLKLLDDEYVSVRVEACLACSNLLIKEQSVIDKLIFVATYDAIWKVKALALQALGLIGVRSVEVHDCVVWALKYEEEDGVRAEACQALMLLKLDDVTQVLQSRLLVENSEIVHNQIVLALRQYGLSASDDMEMVTQVKNEVKKLCTKKNISLHITLNEEAEKKRKDKEEMIAKNKKVINRHMSPKQQLRQLTNVSSGQSTARSMGLSESTVESEILAILDRHGSAHTNKSIKSERTPLPERYHTRSSSGNKDDPVVESVHVQVEGDDAQDKPQEQLIQYGVEASLLADGTITLDAREDKDQELKTEKCQECAAEEIEKTDANDIDKEEPAATKTSQENIDRAELDSEDDGLLDGSISEYTSSEDEEEAEFVEHLITTGELEMQSCNEDSKVTQENPEEEANAGEVKDKEDDVKEPEGKTGDDSNGTTAPTKGIIKNTDSEQRAVTPPKKQSTQSSLTRENSSVTFADPIIKSATHKDKLPQMSSDNTIAEGTPSNPEDPQTIPETPQTEALSRNPSSTASRGKKQKKNLTGQLPEVETAVEHYSQDWDKNETEGVKSV